MARKGKGGMRGNRKARGEGRKKKLERLDPHNVDTNGARHVVDVSLLFACTVSDVQLWFVSFVS